MNQIKNSFFNYTFIFSSYVLTLFSGLFSTSIIARLLGPEKFGNYNIFLLVANVIVLFVSTWMVNPAAAKFATEEFSLSKSVQHTFSSEFVVILINFVLAGFILFVFKQRIMDFLNVDSSVIFFALFVYAFAFSFFSLLSQCALGAIDFKTYGIMTFARSLVFLLLCLVLLLVGSNSILTIVVIFISISYLAGSFFYARLIKITKFVFTKDTFLKLKEIFLFSLPVMFFAFGNFSIDWVDKYFIKEMLTTYAVGIYAAAWMLTRQFTVVSQLAYSVILPIVSSYRINNKIDSVKFYLKHIVPQFSFLFSLLVMFVIVISNVIIFLIYGSDYRESVSIFILLSLSSVFMAVKYFYNPVSTSFNFIKLTGSINLFCACLNIGLIYLLIGKLGIKGAALATCLSSFLAAFGVIMGINKKFQFVSFRSLYCCLPVVGVALFCMISPSLFWRTIFTLLIMVIVYLVFKRYKVFKAKDIEIINLINMPLWLKNQLFKFYRSF